MKTTEQLSEVKKTDMYKVSLDNIREDEGFNVRVDYGDLHELAKSIAEVGVLVPVRAYKKDGIYVLIDGHRRFRAAQLAIAEYEAEGLLIPLITEQKGSNAESRLLEMLLTNEGKRLESFEEAEVYRRFLLLGRTEAEIAKKVGKSPAHISNLLKFNEFGPDVKELVKDKQISTTLASEVLRTSNGDVKVATEKIKKATTNGPVKSRADVGVSKKVSLEKMDKLESALRAANVDPIVLITLEACKMYLESVLTVEGAVDAITKVQEEIGNEHM